MAADRKARTPGPRTFTVTAGRAIKGRRIYRDAVVTIDPDAPLGDGDLALVVLDPDSARAYPHLATYYVPEEGPAYLEGVASQGVRVVGRAIRVQNAPFDPNAPVEGNVAAVSGAPPELGIPQPDQPLDVEGVRA